MIRFIVSTVLCLTVLIFNDAPAQSINASLGGRVSDSAGAALPNVALTLENIQTGVAAATQTNDVGVYLFPSVQPGVYRLSAALKGFQTTIYGTLAVEVSAQVRADFKLQLFNLVQSVDVTMDLASPVSATTPSVSGVIDRNRILNLPVSGRDVLDLVDTQAGVVEENLNGARRGTLNVTRDGVNVMNQFQNLGINSVIRLSPDLVNEVRVTTAPADAELGRGSGQVQVYTRSGANTFQGSIFEVHRNTVLNANTWFNNQRAAPRNSLIRNQFGGRLGGPIIRNKTFFHFLYDGQRQVTRNTFTATSYTALARQGLFRFFPGVQNGNLIAAVPTVDSNGNPIKPATATADLQSVNVFDRDPLRPVMDPTGTVEKLLSVTPTPNNYRFGDGLNTAGYTWKRRATSDRDQYNVRIDHLVHQDHRLNFNWTHQTSQAVNGFAPQSFPDGPGGSHVDSRNFYSVSVTSTISPRMLNEFHAGSQRPTNRDYAAWETSGSLQLPTASGIRYVPAFVGGLANVFPIAAVPRGDFSPLTVWGDSLAWSHRRHTFKLGGEARFSSYDGFNDILATPRANLGATAGFAVTGIGTNPAITGQNLTTAQNLLLNLSGSLNAIRQVSYPSFATDPAFATLKEDEHTVRQWNAREFSLFFKDDWKVKPNLTLNLGVRYEYYGGPRIGHYQGGSVNLIGDSKGLFGWSGSSFADLYRPGPQKGPLTSVEFVPAPGRQPYKDDWNNFAPAVGFTWSIPYFGARKTILRMGYSVGYEKFSLFFPGNTLLPGESSNIVFTPNQYLDLSRMSLPLVPIGKPLETVSLRDRSQLIRTYDENLRTPYVQNWNLAVQRELPGRMSFEVRYVGNKGTRLVRQANINEVNIFESGILEAFATTQAGGQSPLLDRMFDGLTVVSSLGPVNGSTVTASQSLRTNTTTNSFLANNNVGAFADYLNRTTDFTGIAGELIRRAGLPENLIVANPQFSSASGALAGAWLVGNFANSTHHALQIEWNKRSSSGWLLQSSYTWSKTLGEAEGNGPGSFTEESDSYRSLRNRHLDKRLLSFHRTHGLRANGLVELPVGPGKRLLAGDRGLLSRLSENWQFGAVLNIFSGEPIGLRSQRSSFNQYVNDNTPDVVAALPKSFGSVEKDAAGVFYFGGLKLVSDPAIAALPAQLQARSTMMALMDLDNKLVAVNPKPGTLGNLDPMFLEGPGAVRFDLNVVKRVQIGERKQLEFRADAINLMNRTNFDNPDTNINSQTLGRITAANGSSRIIELHTRINF